MKPARLRTAVLVCLVGFFSLNGWLHFQAVQHLPQHAAHSAATHASPLCSWWCAASSLVHSTDLFLDHTFRAVTPIEARSIPTVLPTSSSPTSPRAPPILS